MIQSIPTLPEEYLNMPDLIKMPYLIIDCAHFDENVYQKLIENPTTKAVSLFLNTPHELEGLPASPVLVEFDVGKSADFLNEIMQIQIKYPAVLWLWSTLDHRKLTIHLRKLLFSDLNNGHKLLMRFYDIRCLEGLLRVYRMDNRMTVLEEIPVWAFLKNDNYHYVLSHIKE